MFTYPTFDVEIARKVDKQHLGWPGPGEADDDRNLGCNREYMDLRGRSWREAEMVFALEGELIRRIESAADPVDEYQAVEDELFESDEGLFGLDLGVASTVVALSAGKCVPFSSCNGGAFGGKHHERYPVVAFYAPVQMLALLLASAEEADIGLESGNHLDAYTNDIRKMRAFAESIIRKRHQFAAIPTRRSKSKAAKDQLHDVCS
jgi:hypothetical protein